LFILLVLSACTGLRGAERTLLLMSDFFDSNYKVPSWYTGRNWLLRLGYYKLTREKEKSDDWIWIVDHSVQWGKEKCLVILGIQQSKLPESETILCHEDVEPLALFPVTQSNGKVVYQQLKDTISKTGVPRQIVSDHGPDVKSGIERFCQEYPETIFIYDITHKAATILKKELGSDDRWNEFIALSANTRKKVQQTSLAAIAPPNQRSKARYMNVDLLIKWGMDKLILLDNPEQLSCLDCSEEYFMEKIGWLNNFRDDLEDWSNLIHIIKVTESFVKFQGIYRDCVSDLLALPTYKAETPRARQIRSELLYFLYQESLKAGENDRLLGSSEIIESVFGKTKSLERDQVKSGFTVFVLSLAAIVSKTTSDVVHKALETVNTKSIHKWFQNAVGKSVQSKRVQVNRQLKSVQQKPEPIYAVELG
jgi:hypothetical protein